MFEKFFFERLKDIEFEGVFIQVVDTEGEVVYGKNNCMNLKKYRNNYEYIEKIKDSRLPSLTFDIFIDKIIYGNKCDTMLKMVYEIIVKELSYIEAMEELKRWERFNFSVANSLEHALLILDQQGYVVHYNKKALGIVEIPEKIIKTRPLQDFFVTKLKVMEVLKTGMPSHNVEIFVTTKDGTKKHLLKTILPVKNDNGNIVGIVDKIKEIDSAKRFITNMLGSKASFTFDNIICKSNKMKKVIKIAKNISNTPMSVVLQGESGTGKELFAHSIHNESLRFEKPFIVLDCSTIPKELVESELFGYVEGAFTGAKKGGKLGKFELANGGTIFLDEIGEMPLDIQAKLLRVLQNGTFTKVGGDNLVDVNVRVIAATNRDLKEEVRQKNFREDLYYRLNMISIEIPPLRERKEDIILLLEYFIQRACKILNKEDIVIREDTLKIMLSYSWPGNIRELENAIYRAVSLCNEKEILPIHLPETVSNNCNIKKSKKDKLDVKERELDILEKTEKKQILETLEANGWNKKKASEILGISRSTLYRRIKKYNIFM